MKATRLLLFFLLAPLAAFGAAGATLQEKTEADYPSSDDWTLLQGSTSGQRKLSPFKSPAVSASAQTDNYTLASSDFGKLVTMTHATAKTLTVPPNASVAFPLGTRIYVQQLGAGATSIAAGSGVTITQRSGTLVIGAANHLALLRKTATNTWELTVDPLDNSTTTDPATTDDTSKGYQVGAQWTNTTTGNLFVCTDNTTSAAVWKWISRRPDAYYAADAGANDTYTATLSPAPTSYTTGGHYSFKANTANTGAATINFNGLGAKTIKKVAGGVTTDLADNDIRSGQIVDLVYDGTNMQMQSLLGNAPSGAVSSVTAGQGFGTVSPTTGDTIVNFPVFGEQIIRAAFAPSSGTTWSTMGGLNMGIADTSTAAFITPSGTVPAGVSYTTAAATSGRYAGINSGTTFNNFGLYPVFVARVALNVTAAERAWIGFADSSLAASDNPSGVRFAAFRYSTNASDTTWQCGTNDGTTTGTFTNSGISVDTNIHVFKVVLKSGHAYFYIDGVQVADRTSDLPTGANIVRCYVQVETLAAVNKRIDIYALAEITP